MLTKKEAEDILCFVAQEILSPMAFRNDITASDYWLEKTNDTFNRLCMLVHKYTEKEQPKPQPRIQQYGSINGLNNRR